MHYGSYQDEISPKGLQGIQPRFPFAGPELEKAAEAALPASVWSYLAGGAGDERIQRANVEAFPRRGIVPRMLVGAPPFDNAAGG